MEIEEAIRQRHAVRDYTDQAIEGKTLAALQSELEACNNESGLHIQLVTDEPHAFRGVLAHYGKFTNVKNYVALIGRKEIGLDEKIGYFGERIVLKAQQLGLNSCWVAVTYRKGKSKCVIEPTEKLVCVIALGYGKTQGTPHQSKPLDALCQVTGEMPDWFHRGMEWAALAPTAMNQQKFLFTLDQNKVTAKATGIFYSQIDLGIVKYHFEAGAGKDNFIWG